MVQIHGQLAGIAIAQLCLQISTAAQIPLFPESHTEGYKFDPLLYASADDLIYLVKLKPIFL
jgi:hypothetical protein